jgi:hypothetical protein
MYNLGEERAGIDPSVGFEVVIHLLDKEKSYVCH